MDREISSIPNFCEPKRIISQKRYPGTFTLSDGRAWNASHLAHFQIDSRAQERQVNRPAPVNGQLGISVEQSSERTLRRSTRERRPPERFKDYVMK